MVIFTSAAVEGSIAGNADPVSSRPLSTIPFILCMLIGPACPARMASP
jgi:hypothetical protein